jgi:hypothetical protein
LGSKLHRQWRQPRLTSIEARPRQKRKPKTFEREFASFNVRHPQPPLHSDRLQTKLEDLARRSDARQK